MDMIGKNQEWTHSLYWKYPYNVNDGREDLHSTAKRAVRGQRGLLTMYSSGATPRYAERQGYDPTTRLFAITFRVLLVHGSG